MVRINLLDPYCLSDQHLIAEYNEILMLLGYVRKHPSVKGIPSGYCLGRGHILFFKDKLLYLKKRHGLLKKEMQKRGFRPVKKIILSGFPGRLANDWKPSERDKRIIRQRLCRKIMEKPGYYRHYRKKKSCSALALLVKKG
jgi:deoxyribonuclease (pyrimidine dimer)